MTIERISARGLTADDFVRRYVAENTPVILEDAMPESWAQLFSWTPESLVELAPSDASVKVAPLLADGRDKWVESADLWPGAKDLEMLPGIIHADRFIAVAASRIDVPIRDFAASLRGASPTLPNLYADGASNLEQTFGFLKGLFPEPPDVGKSLLFRKVDLWLGSHTLSTLHFDNYENLFAQLVGAKEFVLCPPSDTSKLVDGRLRKAYASWSAEAGGCGRFDRCTEGISNEAVLNYAAYDIDAPPPEYAERAAKLHRTTVRVRQGEVLYLPFGWWHQVRALPAEHGLCASAASFFEPFFCRFQPKNFTKPGPVIPNPKYRKTCDRLGLNDSDDEDDGVGGGGQAGEEAELEGEPGDPRLLGCGS